MVQPRELLLLSFYFLPGGKELAGGRQCFCIYMVLIYFGRNLESVSVLCWDIVSCTLE